MKKILFLGARQIAWNALSEIIDHCNQGKLKLVGLVGDNEIYTKALTKMCDASFYYVKNDKRRTDEILELIGKTGADCLLSVQHNWILSPEILDAVKGNAFNLHNAKLPDYQGYNSISHAIINGDKEYFSTIHWMEGAVDTGDIAYEEKTVIEPTDTAVSLHRKTISAALRVFGQLLNDILNDAPVPRRAVSKDAFARFYGKDSLKKILDISNYNDPNTVDRFVRGLFYPPHNVAFRVVAGKKLYQLPEAGIAEFIQHGLK